MSVTRGHMSASRNAPMARFPSQFLLALGDALEVLDEAAPDARVVNLETSVTRSTGRHVVLAGGRGQREGPGDGAVAELAAVPAPGSVVPLHLDGQEAGPSRGANIPLRVKVGQLWANHAAAVRHLHPDRLNQVRRQGHERRLQPVGRSGQHAPRIPAYQYAHRGRGADSPGISTTEAPRQLFVAWCCARVQWIAPPPASHRDHQRRPALLPARTWRYMTSTRGR